MKSFFVNAIAKKTVALLLVLAVAVGVAIAAPLAPKAGFGDAKVYDSSYKAVKNPTEVSDGFVLRTATSKVVLSGANAEVEVEANSLLQFISIGDKPVFYLLDGRAIFTSNSPFEVRTTVTTYQGQAGTSIYVITEDEEETAYVNSGLAEATNLITKEVTELGDGQYIDNARRGFTPTSTTKEEYWAKSTPASKQEEAAPAKEETPASTAEETAAQPAETKPAETKPAETAPVVSETVTTEAGALEHTFEYRGFRAVLRAYIGVAELEYPAFVTNEELDAAARAAVYTFPQLTTEIAYEIVEPGFAKIYYPESYGKAEFDYAVQLLEQELAGYIDAVLGLEPEQAPQEPVAEPAETALAGPLVKEFSHRGIEARIEAYIGECDIYYPTFVTNDEIDAAAAAAVWKYPEYTQGITYEVVEPGFAKAYYPTTYGPDEFYFAMGLLESELYAYIDELLATTEPKQELVAAEVPAEEPAAEQPAEPEKTPIETTPKAEEPVAEPAEPAEKKQSDFKFGASAQVIYGNGTIVDDYKSFKQLDYRFGVFYNSFSVIVDPTVEYKNFKVGLHLRVDFRSGKFVNTFTFDTNGVSRIINSVMKYFSLFSFEKGDFSINVDRTTELEFKSPVFSDLKRAYSTYDKLLGTVNYSTGNFKFTAFIDDLSLQAKVDGRSQYTGFRASYTFGKIEVGASAVLNFRDGISKKFMLYPAIDVTVPLTIFDTDFNLEAGIAAQIRSKSMGQGLLAEVSLTKTSGISVIGIGTSLSYRMYFNDVINNGPVDVIKQFKGWAIDIDLKAGIDTKIFKFIGSFSLPISLKKGDTNTLVYHTVKTKSDKTAYITADTFNLQADVVIGKFTFSAGAVYNGLAGRLSDIVKAVLKKEGYNLRERFAALVDPEISTYYGLASISFDIGPGVLDAYIRADLVRLPSDGSEMARALTMPISAGVKYSF